MILWTGQKKKKKKKATTNPKNDNDKCFQYAATIPLKFEEIKKDSKRVMNIKPFIDNYNWEKVNYPSKIEDWKRFEKNYLTISLNLSYIIEKKMYVLLIFKK